MKPAAGGRPSLTNASPVLAALTDSEKAEILDRLIAEDATFAERAGREGRSVLARVEIVDVADVVADALLGLDVEELSRHAGRTRYGYVEPTEAAWLLLEAARQPWLDDIVRRAGLGFHSREGAVAARRDLAHPEWPASRAIAVWQTVLLPVRRGAARIRWSPPRSCATSSSTSSPRPIIRCAGSGSSVGNRTRLATWVTLAIVP
jgi:hypothetical protein